MAILIRIYLFVLHGFTLTDVKEFQIYLDRLE
ncbi:MAG: hypothetical protein JWQ23_3702 [Herminiimonas sp.]|nr:hypothetical protein [Herminiimonas sp.]